MGSFKRGPLNTASHWASQAWTPLCQLMVAGLQHVPAAALAAEREQCRSGPQRWNPPRTEVSGGLPIDVIGWGLKQDIYLFVYLYHETLCCFFLPPFHICFFLFFSAFSGLLLMAAHVQCPPLGCAGQDPGSLLPRDRCCPPAPSVHHGQTQGDLGSSVTQNKPPGKGLHQPAQGLTSWPRSQHTSGVVCLENLSGKIC